MNEKRWTNQYIDLIKEKRERILAAMTHDELKQTRDQLRSLCTAYDEIICELGSGSGGHLLAHAQKSPRTLFIGFELRYKRLYRTIEKGEEREIENLYMVQGDARRMIDFFDDGQLAGIYINFPDPWAKKRWLKHRLINEALLEEMSKKLKPGGFFSHKTDHPEYFEKSLKLIEKFPAYNVELVTRDLHRHPAAERLVKTEFEGLFMSQGKPVHYLLAHKA